MTPDSDDGFLLIIGVLLLFYLFGPRPACAADLWIGATVASYHPDRSSPHNERNWGLNAEYGVNDTWRAAAGAYRNSQWKTSVYAGGMWVPAQPGPWKGAVLVAVLTGYHNSPVPVALPTVMYEGKAWGVNIGVLPSLDRGIGVLGLQIKGKFH